MTIRMFMFLLEKEQERSVIPGKFKIIAGLIFFNI